MKYYILIKSICFFIFLAFSFQARASDLNQDHASKHNEWLLAKGRALIELDTQMNLFNNYPGREFILIDSISAYLRTYDSMKANLYLYRAEAYKRLEMYARAVDDFKSAASFALFQKMSDMHPLLELVDIKFNFGEYDEALYYLERAKTSAYCTKEQKILLEKSTQEIKKHIGNKQSN